MLPAYADDLSGAYFACGARLLPLVSTSARARSLLKLTGAHNEQRDRCTEARKNLCVLYARCASSRRRRRHDRHRRSSKLVALVSEHARLVN